MSQNVTEILSDEAIALLRAGFDRELMYAIVRKTLNGPYPAVAPWTEFLMGNLYDGDGPLGHTQRELIVISQLCAQGFVAPLATHIYWGLVEGLSPAEIAQAIILTGAYAGAQKYVVGIRVMGQMMRMLAECAAEGPEGAGLPNVAQKLLAMYPGG